MTTTGLTTSVTDNSLPKTPEYGVLYVGFTKTKAVIGTYFGYHFQQMLYGDKLFYDVFYILKTPGNDRECIAPEYLYEVPAENERAVRHILNTLKIERDRPRGIITDQAQPEELLPLLHPFYPTQQANKDQKAFELDFKGHDIQIIQEKECLYFNANDVCDVLEYGNPRQALQSHVDELDVQKMDTNISRSDTGNSTTRAVNFVNESGLYCLIFGSKKPMAKEFKLWVTREVLPQIRKTGSYGKGVESGESRVAPPQPALSGPQVHDLHYKEHPIQVIQEEGQHYFKAVHVIEALGYSHSYNALAQHVPSQYIKKFTTQVQNQKGFLQNYTSNFITESGMHCLVLKSQKSGASKLHNWFTSEVPALTEDKGSLNNAPMEVSRLKQFACY